MNVTSKSGWLAIGMLLLGHGFAPADEIFFDDFSDGSLTNDVPVASDGTPVRWCADPPTVADASSGDLILAADMPIGVPAIGVVAEQFNLSDTSIRTQLRRNGEDVLSTGFFVRANLEDTAYVGGIGKGGDLFITREPGTAFLGVSPILFDPNQELILQMDVIGDTLQLWAWPPGSPMPLEPQLTVTDFAYTEGAVGLYMDFDFQGAQGSTGTTVFRYVQLADTQIPEPAAAILCGVGLMCFFLLGRKNQRA